MNTIPHHSPANEPLEYRWLWLYRKTTPLMDRIAGKVRAQKEATRRADPTARLDVNFSWYDGISPRLMAVRKGATNWDALNQVYNWKMSWLASPLRSLAELFWFNMRNAQSVRNRKRIVAGLIRHHARAVIGRKGSVTIVSLACGSAQAVIEGIRGYEGQVKLFLIDSNQEALDHAKRLVALYCPTAEVHYIKGDVRSLKSLPSDEKPDIVEVVGLIDYFSDTAINRLFATIHRGLAEGGVLLSGHIHPNPEMRFLEYVSDWRMKYRSQEELLKLAVEAGFPGAMLYPEPHGINPVVAGIKE